MYPEHEKLKAASNQSNSVGAFLDWLQNDKEYQLCELVHDNYEPVYRNINNLLAEYFEIDEIKLEKEKQQMIEECQKLNGTSASN